MSSLLFLSALEQGCSQPCRVLHHTPNFSHTPQSNCLDACAHTHSSRSLIEQSSTDTHQTRRPLFPLGWEGHQKLSNHHSEKTLWDDKTEAIGMKEVRWLNSWVPPSEPQPHHAPQSCALFRCYSPAQWNQWNGRRSTTQRTLPHDARPYACPFQGEDSPGCPHHTYKVPCLAGKSHSPAAVGNLTTGLFKSHFVPLCLAWCPVHSVNTNGTG